MNALTRLEVHNLDMRWGSPSHNLTWPMTLPVELALRTTSPNTLKHEYNYSDEDWENLRHNPVFIAELTQACEMVRKEGVPFRMKAGLQADPLLETTWKLIHSPNDEVSPAVKADLIKSVVRWAGLDVKAVDSAGGVNASLNIQINL